MTIRILSNQTITLKDIAKTSEIAENTIKNAYRDIYPYFDKIIPPEH